MADSGKGSPGAIGLSAGLGVLALLFWALTLATLADLAGSDAAGNAYAQAYAAIEIFILWGLLAVIAIIAAVKGAMAWPAMLAAAILIPASGVVTFEALELLSRPRLPPFLWPLIIPALAPLLIMSFSIWALFTSLRDPCASGGWDRVGRDADSLPGDRSVGENARACQRPHH